MAARKTPEEARAAREAKLEELHEQLRGSVEQLVTGEDWARVLTFAAQFRSRSFNNTLLIFLQHQLAYEAGRVPEPFPSYVAGYRQWEQLGRHVDKGQRGYAIFAPVTGRFASSNPKDPMSWRRLGRGEKPLPGEMVRTKMIGARPAYVFDLTQTSGVPVPLPPRAQLLEGMAPAGLREGLIRQIEAAGFQFVMVDDARAIGGANGITDFTNKIVSVRSDMDDAAQVKTIAHELAHVLMHDPEHEDATRHRGMAEVEAESVALMVGAAHGMDTSSYTVPYVSTWALNTDGKDPVAIVTATAEKVRKTSVAILDQLDTDQLGDGTPPGLTRDQPERPHGRTGPAAGRAPGQAANGTAPVENTEAPKLPGPVPSAARARETELVRSL